jgi:hypothetical protein
MLVACARLQENASLAITETDYKALLDEIAKRRKSAIRHFDRACQTRCIQFGVLACCAAEDEKEKDLVDSIKGKYFAELTSVTVVPSNSDSQLTEEGLVKVGRGSSGNATRCLSVLVLTNSPLCGDRRHCVRRELEGQNQGCAQAM